MDTTFDLYIPEERYLNSLPSRFNEVTELRSTPIFCLSLNEVLYGSLVSQSPVPYSSSMFKLCQHNFGHNGSQINVRII